MYQKALKFRDEHITDVTTYEEFKDVLNNKGGYVKMPWCGDEACEVKIKDCLLYTSLFAFTKTITVSSGDFNL